MSGSVDRKRNKKRLFLIAFIVLVLLYTFKLAYPQHTAATIYTTQISKLKSVAPYAFPYQTITTPDPTTSVLPSDFSSVADNALLPSAALNNTIHDRAAIIIESRFRLTTIPLILHYSSILGPLWPILIYTSPESLGSFTSSSPLRQYLSSGAIQIRILPQTTMLVNKNALNELMTSDWIWESLEPAEYLLFFQSDSTLCGNAARSVEDYLQYDYIGAPMGEDYKKDETGLSLSLRRRSAMIRVLEEWDWKAARMDEDEWFWDKLKQLAEQEKDSGIEPHEDGAINLPAADASHTFSIQRMGEYANPLGVHQVHRWRKNDIARLDEWCPEYKLCSGDFGWWKDKEYEKSEEESKKEGEQAE